MHTMKETCNLVNIPYETLKFYCNQGLVPNVKRDVNNRRIFDDNDIEWLKSLSCLRNCGMSIQEMRTYAELCLKGASSIPERKIMLAAKKEDLLKSISKLQECVEYIEMKQQFYDEVVSGKTKYYCNLLPET